MIANNEDHHASARAHYVELARIGKVLASPVRLHLIDLLRQGARSVEALAEAAGVSVANSSQHLQLLRSAKLVAAGRRGQRVEYRLAADEVSRVFGALRGLAEALLPEMERLRRELRALDAEAREELLSRVRCGDVMLLDVRPADEYCSGHLPGARSIPLGDLRERVAELPRDREVVAYCRGPYCPLAIEAVAILEAAGYRARHLDLGVPELRTRRFRILAGDRPGAAQGPARRPRARDRAITPSNGRTPP